MLNLYQKFLMGIAGMFRCYPGPGKSVVWNRLQPTLEMDEKIVVQFPQGHRFHADLKEYWQRQMIAACYDRRETWILSKLVREKDTFFDVGANAGYYSVLAGSIVKSGNVFSFEPHPRMVSQLRENLKVNSNLNITAIEAAVCENAGKVVFYLPPDNGWQSVQGSMLEMEQGTKCEVSGITLDSVIEENQIKKVQLCKIDVEGVELAALRGAKQSLKNGILESISCEISSETQREIFDFMSSFGFKTIFDIRTWKPANVNSSLSNLANVIWLRGACEERWNQIKWQRFFI